jgi:hypothetical protein
MKEHTRLDYLNLQQFSVEDNGSWTGEYLNPGTYPATRLATFIVDQSTRCSRGNN